MKKRKEIVKKSTSNANMSVTKQGAISKKNFYMLPLIIALAVIPFIIRYHEYDTGLSNFSWFSPEDSHFDFFLYYKSQIFVVICSIMILLIAWHCFHNKKQVKLAPIFIPLSIYGLLCVLSTIFSKYPSLGYIGAFEQFESVFVLLGYCVVIVYAFIFINNREDIEYIFKIFTISVLIMGVIGIFQVIGHDLLTTNIIQKLMIPKKYWNSINQFSSQYNDVYLTLYNSNYVGVYTALTIPIYICFILTTNNRKNLIFNIAALVMLIICLVGSGSSAGVIAIGISLIFIFIFLRKYIFKNMKISITIISLGLIMSILLISLNYNKISDKINNLLNSNDTKFNLTDIKTDDNIEITYNNNILKIDYVIENESSISFNFTDDNDQIVSAVFNPADYSFDILDERYPNFNVGTILQNQVLCIKVTIDNKPWIFTNQLGDDTYYYVNNFGRPDKIITSNSQFFNGYESFATGRGYIWSRTIPLLNDYVFLGSGADTFSTVFPHQDYVNLYNYGFSEQVLTKPHSLYLQIGIQTGVLSLIAFLTFYAMYFFSSILIYRNGIFDDLYYKVGIAIFISTISYMVVSLANDSSITVSPVFWALLGIGISINHKIKNDLQVK